MKVKAVASVIVLALSIFGLTQVEPITEPTKQDIVKVTAVEQQEDVKAPAEKKQTKKEKTKSTETVKTDTEAATVTPKTVTKKQPKSAQKPSATNQQTKPKADPKPEPKPTHVHNWEPVYSVKVVEDIGHEIHEICKGCGADITSWSTSKWNAHSDEHLKKGEPAGFYEKEIKVVTGTHEITKITGYKCSCGATK